MAYQQVQKIPLLQHLGARGRAALLKTAKEERYERGDTLFRQGEKARHIWLILEGWVHLMRATDNGHLARGVVIFTITPEEALCGLSAVDESAYALSAVAATRCRAICFDGDAFRAALLHEPAFAYHALRLYARRFRHIAQQYGSMVEPVSHRIVRAVLRLEQQFGPTLPVTHRELAQMAWTTTESAIRTVRRLKRLGVLEGSRGRLTVRKPSALTGVLGHPDV